MVVALTVLCTGAVAFLLRVLVALVREWMGPHPLSAAFHFARFNPSRQQGQLLVMNRAIFLLAS